MPLIKVAPEGHLETQILAMKSNCSNRIGVIWPTHSPCFGFCTTLMTTLSVPISSVLLHNPFFKLYDSFNCSHLLPDRPTQQPLFLTCGCRQRSLLGAARLCCSEVTQALNQFQHIYNPTPARTHIHKRQMLDSLQDFYAELLSFLSFTCLVSNCCERAAVFTH